MHHMTGSGRDAGQPACWNSWHVAARFCSAFAAATTLALVGAGPAASSVGGGAYAVSANVNALVAPVSAGALPSVSLPAEGGGPFTESLLSANVIGLAPVQAARVSTQGNSGTGTATSSASMVDASIAGLVTVRAARSRCTATSADASASASAVDLVVAGIPVSTVNAGPNTTITLPVGRVVVNEQLKSSAAAITVNAVRVSLDAAVASGDIVIAQSRCSVRSSSGARAKQARRARKAQAKKAFT